MPSSLHERTFTKRPLHRQTRWLLRYSRRNTRMGHDRRQSWIRQVGGAPRVI